MGSIFPRGPVLHIAYQEPGKPRPTQKSSKIRIDGPGGEAAAWKEARAMLEAVEADIASGAPVETGPLTLLQMAQRSGSERKLARKELGQLRNHAAELLGMELSKIDQIVLTKWVRRLSDAFDNDPENSIAPRTIWHVWNTVRQVLTIACDQKRIQGVPVPKKGSLPSKVDSDPEWRDGAVFMLHELIQLMTDERIPLNFRVMYAIKAMTGARHGEAVALRWCDIHSDATPLPRISLAWQFNGLIIKRTKTKATKMVPLHPALASILNEWKASVTERDGKAPADDARICDGILGRPMTAGEANPALHAHLATLGLRVRDGHDLRRSFITALLEAGAPPHVVEQMTHARAVVRNAFDAYVSKNYAAMCDAMLLLKVRVLRSIAMPMVAQASATADGAVYCSTTGVVANYAESLESEGKTVLPRGMMDTMTRSNDNGHLRPVPSAKNAPKPMEKEPDRSSAVTTDQRIDALEAALMALATNSQEHAARQSATLSAVLAVLQEMRQKP